MKLLPAARCGGVDRVALIYCQFVLVAREALGDPSWGLTAITRSPSGLLRVAGAPRLSISFIRISLLAEISVHRAPTSSGVSVKMRPASAASKAAMHSAKLSRWAKKRFITPRVSLLYTSTLLGVYSASKFDGDPTQLRQPLVCVRSNRRSRPAAAFFGSERNGVV
jgi:hypothetical protein